MQPADEFSRNRSSVWRRAFASLESEDFRDMIEALPAAVSVADVSGRLTYFNRAAEALWGRRPPSDARWSDAWRLLWPDGSPISPDDHPMALAIKGGRPLGGVELVVEREDGTCIPVMAFATPVRDEDGSILGSVITVVELGERKLSSLATQRLAAIVENSDDAILTKDLDGIITSWNGGAQRLFGYRAEEVIGKPVTILIPPDRVDEEPRILAAIRAGQRVDHYETVRRRKDGSLVDISLTVSPLKGLDGEIVGASKIARDITERRAAEERQELLLREMGHRVKNLFSIANGIVALSARSADSAEALARDIQGRLTALAKAQALTMPGRQPEEPAPTSLQFLIRTLAEPYDYPSVEGRSRFSIAGDDIEIAPEPLSGIALAIHELLTNAAKHGALSSDEGRIEIACARDAERFSLDWRETGGPAIAGTPAEEGFGSLLTRMTIESQLGGRIRREWAPGGLRVTLAIPTASLAVRASGDRP